MDDYDIPDDKLDALMGIAVDIREMFTQGTFPDFWGTRQQIKVARKTRFYSLEKAFLLATLNFYEPQIRDLVLAIVRTYD
jgi:hypothetical protein